MKKNDWSTTEKEIKKALIDTGVKQTQIARELKISKQYVNSVIRNLRRTQYVREAIARHARKRVEDLWPSRPLKKAA